MRPKIMAALNVLAPNTTAISARISIRSRGPVTSRSKNCLSASGRRRASRRRAPAAALLPITLLTCAKSWMEAAMGKILWGAAAIVVLVLAAVAGVLAFDAPSKPPTLASIQDPFATVDFRDMPPVQTYATRDGVKLGYRVYEG